MGSNLLVVAEMQDMATYDDDQSMTKDMPETNNQKLHRQLSQHISFGSGGFGCRGWQCCCDGKYGADWRCSFGDCFCFQAIEFLFYIFVFNRIARPYFFILSELFFLPNYFFVAIFMA